MGVIFLQEKTKEQPSAVRNLKKEGLKAAGEVFEGHREQVFAALQFFSQCICIARRYGLLALDAVAEGGDQDSQEEWWGEDKDIALAVSMIGRDMPLKELLLYMMRKLVDFKTLAAGIAFAKEPVRKRFLENMPEWQRNLVANELYNMRYDGYHWKDNLKAMDRMLMVAGLTGEA